MELDSGRAWRGLTRLTRDIGQPGDFATENGGGTTFTASRSKRMTIKVAVRSAVLGALLFIPGLAFAGPAGDCPYLRYSYRDHYNAYGATSALDTKLPPDELYPDVCHRWVGSGRHWKLKLVCR